MMNGGHKLITWIIPVYNGEKYILQTIDSILRQPCKDSEILVVDDGSTDNTFKIVKNYINDRVRIVHKENGGVSTARNLGIELATSKYIAFLDADDVLCKDAYNEYIHSILVKEKYDLLSFSYFTGDQNLKYGNRRSVQNGEGECDHTKLDPFKHCSSFIYHHSIFEKDSPVRFPKGVKIREDVVFQFLAYKQARNMLNIDHNWFVYRNNISSVMHQVKNDYIIKNTIPAWNWCKNLCDDKTSREHCDIRLFAEVSEYIRLSCMAGVTYNKIIQNLESDIIKECLINYDIFWNNSKKQYESFRKNPKQYWLKYRIKGIVLDFGKKMIRMPLLREKYFRIKYKNNIQPVVYIFEQEGDK